MKPISSAITLPPMESGSKTGMPGSEPGLETRSSGAVSVQPDRLLERSPADNLAAAVWSLQDCGLSVKHEVTGSRFPETGGWEPVMSLTVTASDSPDRETAERIIAGLSAPAPQDKIIEWLTTCAVLTAAPRDDDMTAEFRLRVFANELANYPGDIVRQTLADWPRKSKWFPAWRELQDVLEKHCGIRPMLVDHVKRELRRTAR